MMMTAETLSYSMSLKKLLQDFVEVNDKVIVEGLCIDSRQVKPGDLFLAYIGVNVDGRLFIDDAIKAGAVAVLTEAGHKQKQGVGSIPVIEVENLKPKIGIIASRFYQYPSEKTKLVGITGTNGKSSVTYLISNALALSGRRCASIGTLGYGIDSALESGVHTTPDPITLQKLLASWCNEIRYTVMEVSSHSLDQDRVNGMEFYIAVLTNLSRDHLDYHKDIESYSQSKGKLFEFSSLQHTVINLDDDFGKSLIYRIRDRVNTIAYTLNRTVYEQYHHSLDIIYGQPEATNDQGHTIINIKSPWGNGKLRTAFIGKFNVENMLAGLAVLCLLEIPIGEAIELLSQIGGVPGRMEQYKKIGHPLLVVDYAHTPDALEKAQQTLKKICHGELVTIFGCGGDRDKGKRAEMGAIAESIADKIILTNDNPRTEDPEQIITDILAGIKDKSRVSIITDRSEAITTTFHHANEQDVILIAGKGHEAYQEIKGKRYPFSDRELARRLTVK